MKGFGVRSCEKGSGARAREKTQKLSNHQLQASGAVTRIRWCECPIYVSRGEGQSRIEVVEKGLLCTGSHLDLVTELCKLKRRGRMLTA